MLRDSGMWGFLEVQILLSTDINGKSNRQIMMDGKKVPTSTILPLSMTTILSAACMVESLYRMRKLTFSISIKTIRRQFKRNLPVRNNYDTSLGCLVSSDSTKNTLDIMQNSTSSLIF